MLDANGISYFAWSLSNKSETSALLKSGTSKKSGWSTSDLSEAGKWVFAQYKSRSGSTGSQTDSDLTAPVKVKGLKLKKIKGKKIKVTFDAVEGASGYQIRYSDNKNFKKAKNVTSFTNKVTLKKLKKKKSCYVKVRAYKTSGNVRKYGKYSGVKVIKIK
jgi:hypothetical protein